MEKIFVPPIKIQGIKTKLVPLIKKNICVDENTIWIEPFMGSGVVGFNVRPSKAIFSDINPHLINFYNALKAKKISSKLARNFLSDNGKILSERGNDFYIEVRERFNKFYDPLDFLFLNRSGFNGMIRFNKSGKLNVPYCHKPQRFSKSYITKIVNQIHYLENCFEYFDWQFVCQDFRDSINFAENFSNVFIYCDPPYIGRHVDYYDNWTECEEKVLCDLLKKSGKNFMLSTWFENNFRKNDYVETLWNFCNKIFQEHFYYVGAKEINRHAMTETLLTNYFQKNYLNLFQENKKIFKQMTLAI